MSALLSHDSSETVSCPEEFLQPLWSNFQYFDHQVHGIRWMLDKERIGTLTPGKKQSDPHVLIRGGMQCDEMGLGKTIQVVATIVHNPLPLTVLLVPLAMIDTWTTVCQRAGLSVYHAIGYSWIPLAAAATAATATDATAVSVYITNHEKLYTTPRLFRSLTIHRIVIDEAQRIRSPSSQIAIYARRLGSSGTIRWAVTGTPLVNQWSDVISLLAFLGVPYSPLLDWEDRYTDLLPAIVLHRSLESLRSVLPDAPPYPVIHHVKLPFASQKEQEFYHAIQGVVLAQTTGSADPSPYEFDQLTPQQSFLLLLRLRQISVHPQIYINAKRRESTHYFRRNWNEQSTKLLAIRDILLQDFSDDKNQEENQEQENQEQEQEQHNYLLFCQFDEEIQLIRDYLLSLNLFHPTNILQYQGSMSRIQRDAVLAHSKRSKEPTVLLLQLQAGGVGLNLQEYDRIIFVSPWWTSALIDQAIARAVRMGQTRIVHVYHLLLDAETESSSISIDSLVQSKADIKKNMLLDFFHICHTHHNQEHQQDEEHDEEQENE